MARYSIDGQILTDIADAVRGKTSETITEIYDIDNKNIIFQIANATSWVYCIDLPNVKTLTITINSLGSAEGEEVEYYVLGYKCSTGLGYDYLKGQWSSNGNFRDGTSNNTFPITYSFSYNPSDNNQTGVVIGMKDVGAYDKPLTKIMSLVLTAIDESGNVLKNISITHRNPVKPENVAEIISDMAIVPGEALHLTGDCSYRFSNGGQDWLINTYGDRITTNNLTNATSMFEASKVKSIPFELNFNGSDNMLNTLFKNSFLTEIPKINNAKPTISMSEMFYGCQNLRYLPEDIETWFDWSNVDKATGSYDVYRGRNTFNGCSSLRSVPMGFLNHNNPYATGSSYNLFYGLFQNCYCLDEIVGLPLARVGEKAWTSNMFSSTFNNCYRLKNMTFATNEDGSPIVANWKSQTIDLSSNVGYASTVWYITDFNSGITADKEVNNGNQYEALKNDPDWFASHQMYSRYDHDSAVRTINSLPDTTSSGGTNTIKFKGAAGSATDAGAINTLTAEEIAVATAKGWTVSLV